MLDVDGTLADASTRLTSRTSAALVALLDRGYPVVIATARSFRSVRVILGADLVGHMDVVHLNGAVTHEHDSPHTPLVSAPLSRDVVASMVELADKLLPEARIVLEHYGLDLGTNIELVPDVLWATNRATPDMVHSIPAGLDSPISKVAISSSVPVGPFVEEVRSTFGTSVHVADEDRFDAGFVQIVSSGVSKERAVAAVLNRRGGLHLGTCLAIGDDRSDLGLLDAAGYGIAMANAHPAVLARARYITASNEENGVAIVLEQLLSPAP